MNKIILAPIIGALIINLALAEKSAFLAGDPNSATPYGLTDTEKVMLKNKELNVNVGVVSSKVGSLEEQIDGIRSVLDGTSERMNSIDRRLKALEMTYGDESNASDLPTKVEDLRAYLTKNRQIQAKNNQKVKKVLKELSSLIDSINSNYVSKKSYNELLARIDKLEGKKTPKTIVKTETKVDNTVKLSGKELQKEAKKLYLKSKYQEAKALYEQSISKNYKPALSNFMIGEIEYKQKSYSNAITYYKKSIELYDKASYIPKLLYHTAISFDKLGDRKNADKFYSAIKSNYPNSKEAKVSR